MNATTTITPADAVTAAEAALADVHRRLELGDARLKPLDLARAEEALQFAKARKDAAERAEAQRLEQDRQRELAERRRAMAERLAATLERREAAEQAAFDAITALVAASGEYGRALSEAAPLNETTAELGGADLVVGGRVWPRPSEPLSVLNAHVSTAVNEAWMADRARRQAARQNGAGA